MHGFTTPNSKSNSRMLKKGTVWSLMIFCARATRGLRRPSLDARSGRSIRPIPKEGIRSRKIFAAAFLDSRQNLCSKIKVAFT